MTTSAVGQAVERKDAREKTTGRAVYATDISQPAMLHAKVLRSSRPHARLLSIDVSAARSLPGVHAVLTHEDIPAGLSPQCGYFIKDQPIVASDRVRYIGDVICAVAAETEEIATEALSRIQVVYDDLPVVADIEAALEDGAAALFEHTPPGSVPPYGQGALGALYPSKNICYQFSYTTGDASEFENCDLVFEDEFRFSRMQHYTLEPFVAIAKASADQITVWTPCQNPFPLRKELSRIFKIPENRISIQVPFIGGSFGAKNSCKNEPIAILLSMLSGRPVRYCLTMEEAFYTNTQHAAILKLRTGVMRDGTLVARQSEIYLDAGAYSDASPLVAEKAGYRIPGPYRYKHIDSKCYCVLTNTAPAGAFRGFGGTQATWASESQIDMIARRIGMDPYQFRMKNFLDRGEPFVPGETGVDSDLGAGLELIASHLGYHDRAHDGRRGWGLAVGFKDGGGVRKAAQAQIKVSSAGDIFLLCATAEVGQGARTSLAQIAAEVLNTASTRVVMPPVNTDYLPFDHGTNASSSIAVMGRAVEQAARRVKSQILECAAEQLNCDPAELTLEDWTVLIDGVRHPLQPLVLRSFGGPGFEFIGEGLCRAKADHGAPLEAKSVYWEIGWAGAEVEIDMATGSCKVLKLVVSGDTGRSIHPLICRGQEEGGAVMGFAQAMFEQMIYDGQGKLVNQDPLVYRVPLAEDLPAEFDSITQEQGFGPGPFGAKGAGEATMLPVASAIANAIEDAIGVRITQLPLTAERVWRAIRSKAGD
ncbi:MAG: Xanthine dehydrogenase, molybdenum binding subunit [Burkholderia sp.]|nr:Xanthine dehydrogenase, molybdenum binding subunit [Burkholderia sp.]